MVYGKPPQHDPRLLPLHTFTYLVAGANATGRIKAITVAARTDVGAKALATQRLDDWHGSGCWAWHD